MKQVKITQCNDGSWYKNRIGEVFTVDDDIKENYNQTKYYTIKRSEASTGGTINRIIHTIDCEDYTRNIKLKKIKQRINKKVEIHVQ